MPNEHDALLNRLIGGDPDASAEILAAAAESNSPALLVAAALLTGDEEFLTLAHEYAVTGRDRQLTAVAAAHLRGDADVFDVLVRDHLSDHPDNLLAAWLAGIKIRPTTDATPHKGAPAMSKLTTASPPATTGHQATRRVFLRWMASFAGFPLGGFAAIVLTGPVENLTAALAGGLATGAVLGTVQAWAFGATRPNAIAWIAATAVGLMVGLGFGASLVDFETNLGSLVIQGAVCGLFVGVAQAAVLMPRVGVIALAWPVALSAIWAAGWAITTAIGVQVDEQFTVFGSAGAIAVTALTAVLPLHLNRHNTTEKSTS